MENLMNPEMEIILKEMCQRVDADYNTINFQKEGWYNEYEWSSESQANFIEWLANYLYSNTKARKLFGTWSKNKKLCQKAANSFIWFCWKYKKDENLENIDKNSVI